REAASCRLEDPQPPRRDGGRRGLGRTRRGSGGLCHGRHSRRNRSISSTWSPPASGGGAEFEAAPAADEEGVEQAPLLARAARVGEMGQQGLERDAPLEARERGAEAEVLAEAEAEVPARVAARVEAVGVREAALVAVGGAEQQRDDRVPGDADAAQHG